MESENYYMARRLLVISAETARSLLRPRVAPISSAEGTRFRIVYAVIVTL